VLLAVAIAAVACLPGATSRSRWLRLVGTVLIGTLALAGTVWQARKITAMGMLATATAREDRPNSLLADLKKQVGSLKLRISELKQSATTRMIRSDTGKRLADYLSKFGSRSVVVFCVPNDVEAYDYATQLTNVLKSAGWDARGPEVTTIFGDVRAIGVNVYDDAAPGGDTAKILLDGLARFNIPFQIRVASPEAADDAAVELFVGAQPVARAAATAEQKTR
jgi:hypothetical protein